MSKKIMFVALILFITNQAFSEHMQDIIDSTKCQSSYCDSGKINIASIKNQCESNNINYERAVSLVANLQEAFKTNNIKTISSFLSYPVTIYSKNNKFIIKSESEFEKKYTLIMTDKTKDFIIKHDPRDIFCNYQGASFGYGTIWFNTDNGNQGIFTININ